MSYSAASLLLEVLDCFEGIQIGCASAHDSAKDAKLRKQVEGVFSRAMMSKVDSRIGKS